jgi:hypothetical protein
MHLLAAQPVFAAYRRCTSRVCRDVNFIAKGTDIGKDILEEIKSAIG